jgi:hypothetical protein
MNGTSVSKKITNLLPTRTRLLGTLYLNPEGFSADSPGPTLIFIRTSSRPYDVMDSNARPKNTEEGKSD